jgi:hypothetical protein
MHARLGTDERDYRYLAEALQCRPRGKIWWDKSERNSGKKEMAAI